MVDYNKLKTLYDAGEYESILTKMNIAVNSGILDSFNETDYIQCIYYLSRSHLKLGDYSKSLEIASGTYERVKFSAPPLMLLLLITIQLWAYYYGIPILISGSEFMKKSL